MTIPELHVLDGFALLVLRLVLAAVFVSSGWADVTRPTQRSESLEMPVPFTILLGLGELAAAASIAVGVYAQLGALLLVVIMVGAIRKKIFVWHTGFFGGESRGWFYDLLYLSCNLVIVATGGGAWVLLH